MSLEVRLQRPISRNRSELIVTSVYRHVQHHALIKDKAQINKIISILYHSYCENLTWHGTEREICTYGIETVHRQDSSPTRILKTVHRQN